MTRTGFPERLRLAHQNRRLNSNHRRNGKLQSCEPCRKAKMACDHMLPVCGRCVRRNREQHCVYHPAPLTKSASIPTPQSSHSTAALSPSTTSIFPSTEAHSPSAVYQVPQPFNSVFSSTLQFPPFEEPAVQPRFPRASSLPAQLDPSGLQQVSLEEIRRLNAGSNGDHFQKSAGFVASSAILFENEASIGVDLTPTLDNQIGVNQSGPTKAHIQQGVAILALLKDMPTFNKYIEKWYSFTRGTILIEPIVKLWASGLWTAHHQVLERQKPEALTQLSEKVWRNTLKPLELNYHTTPYDFIAMTTGENLRWEVIGLIFNVIGLLGQTLQDGDPVFCSHDEAPVDRQALVMKVYNASETCIKLCEDFELMNDLYLWLLYCGVVMFCSLRAKGSYVNWQRCTYMIQAVIAFGLHQEIKPDAHTPFFLTEFRKRLFISCYEDDKFSACFVGRPPRLTREWVLLQLPLDLSDSDIMNSGPDVESVIGSLDEAGWNKKGVVQTCTFSRIGASNALITEEILQISLGTREMTREEIIARANDIEARARQLYDGLPSFLKVNDEDPFDRRRAPIEHLFLIYIRLSDLGISFLIQRTLIKKAQADSYKLIAVSQKVFKFMLVVIANRDKLRDFHIDFIQLICMYGIQSAAVLAVELLKQEKERSEGREVVDTDRTIAFPRSDTIQDLSVFVACLATIRPDNCGFSNCERGRKFIKRILDTILDPSSKPAAAEPQVRVGGDGSIAGPAGVAHGVGAGLDMPLFPTGDDGEFMRWLEMVEWEDSQAMVFT